MNNEENKNRIYKWGAWALIVLTVFLGVNTLAAFKKLQDKDPAYNSISVIGEGDVVAVPDVATFSFAVSADAKTVSDAQTAVTTKMDKILAALKNAGVEEKDIKTDNYNVYPKYRYETSSSIYPGGRQVPDGYTASHNVTVKVRKTEDAGKILGLAGDNGATNISGITFTQDDPEKAISDAREEAIANARAKAKTLAKQLDVRLVRVISYYDNSGPGTPVPYYGGIGMGGAVDAKLQSAPTIPIGENKTKVTVTITYEIR